MIQDYFSLQIRARLTFDPTEEQAKLLSMLGEFLANENDEKAFLLCGYAGTGKTSIIAALVKAIKILNIKSLLLAPTGRAAKVLSNYSSEKALTIHKKIYRQKSISDLKFQLNENLHTNTIFIVDEASMISNQGYSDTSFGSGNLLEDLIQFVYSGNGCCLIIVGDTAQLPPIMQSDSPALNPKTLSSYGLNVFEFTLTQVVRQALESGILTNATEIREKITKNETNLTPTIQHNSYPDITMLKNSDIVDEIERAYNGVGVKETIIITRTNWQSKMYNNGIRSRVLMKDDEISNGDLLMVTKNNYYWNKPYKEIDFIANGDILEVQRVKKYHEMYGFRFVDLSLRSLDYNWEIDALILLESLNTDTQTKLNEITSSLFNSISEDYPEITRKNDLYKAVFENQYFNALQVKFGYAITCHKAQGGQWEKVFVDIGQIKNEHLNTELYRWVYTAITRAKKKLFLINFPEKLK